MDIQYELGVLLRTILLQFNQIFFYWFIGLIAGSIINVFAAAKIKASAAGLNGKGFGFLPMLAASLLGALSPICMYGTVPIIVSFGRKGVSQHILAAFMVSSILINPNLFIFSFALGWRLALTRLLLALLAGLTAGVLIRMFFKAKSLFNYEGFEGNRKCGTKEMNIEAFLKDLHRAVTKTAPYFILGITITALFDMHFPKNLITDLFSSDKGFGVLLSASIGVPVYVCGGGTIPLLKAWLNAGMSPGSAAAFMISGPATKITNLSGVKIILGLKNFILYIAFNMIFSVAAGLAVNVIYRN